MKQRMKKILKHNQKHFLAFVLACIMTVTGFIPNIGFLSAHATISTPKEINDLGYLGRGVNLLREVDTNDKSDDLLSQNHLKVVLDDSDLSDFNVSKDPISSSYGQGYTSKNFASLAMSMGVDLSTKASASTNFIIGSAKLSAGFSMSMNVSVSASTEIEYTIYNYQKYLDAWTLNWDNGGVKDSATSLREHLSSNVYGALTDSFPQYTWSPQDFFETYGTHIIVSYKRGGEYTYSSKEIAVETQTSIDSSSSIEASGETKVSSFGSAGFESKVSDKETVEGHYKNNSLVTTTFSRGSSKGQLDETNASSVNTWGDGVDNENAQVLSSGLTLVSMWDLLPSQYADRKAELKNYYNEKVANTSNDLLNKFVYKSVNEGDFDFSQYDYVISSPSQLSEIRNNMKGRYILACDIDLGLISNWEPIGTELNKFTGIFDGNNNTISNLNITNCDEPYIGLFGYNAGTIKNVSVEGSISLNDSNIRGLGGIAGYNSGVIENCQNKVEIKSTLGFVDDSVDDETIIAGAPTVDMDLLLKDAKVISATTVNDIPEYIEESSILDLTALNGDINRTVKLGTGAEALRIIGNSQKKYIGLNLELENSTFDKYIAFENVNIVYSSEKGAIWSNSESAVWLISEGDGNSITTNEIGISSAITVENKLNIIGSAKFVIEGSDGKAGEQGAYNGTNGTGAGSSGKAGGTGSAGNVGGIGVIAGEIAINLEPGLEVIGGTGGAGGVGGTGANGLKGSNAGFIWVGGGNGGDGGIGGTGGTGGTGGKALEANSLVIFAGTIEIKGGAGGIGGTGGTGGTGGAGGNGIWAADGKTGVGGTGGNGGAGGMFGDALSITNTVIKVYGASVLVLNDNGLGTGGNAGIGGNGRNSRQDGKNGGLSSVPNTQQRVAYYTSNAKYSLYDTSVTYDEVTNILSTLGEQNLISIHSSQDQLIVENLFDYYDAPSDKMYWIGAERAATNLNRWNWLDGSTFEYDYRDKEYKVGESKAYTNWADGQPTSSEDVDYVSVNSSNGLWYANLNTVKGGFITKETLDSGIGASNYNFYVGSAIGYNKGMVNRIINEADIQLTVKTKDDFACAVSGVVGFNNGELNQVANNGKIDIHLISIDNPSLNADITVKKITEELNSDDMREYKNCGSKGKFTSEGYYGSSPKWEWVNEDDAGGQSTEYHSEWENQWDDSRIHVASIEKTEFLQGDVLSYNIIELSYIIDNNGTTKSSYSYTYKYDFSQIGVTAIRVSFKYNEEPMEIYVPVKVSDIVATNVVIDLIETKLDYQYGDEFVCPIIKKTMSDGMTESFMADIDWVYDIPAMTSYGTHEITVYYDDYVLNYEINISQKVVESTAAQLKIQNRTSVAGGNVIVQFKFENMPELKSVLLYSFVYDDVRLEIVEGRWKATGIIEDWDAKQEMATFTYAQNEESNVYIFELELRVKDDCPAGNYTVSCAALVNSCNDQGVDIPVSLEVAPGNVSVIDVPRGDFNDDGQVDEDDAIYLLRYTLFGDSLFTLNQNGDVNGDDILNSDDAIYLLRNTLLPEKYPLYW